jgi:hypothetical protein
VIATLCSIPGSAPEHTFIYKMKPYGHIDGHMKYIQHEDTPCCMRRSRKEAQSLVWEMEMGIGEAQNPIIIRP